MDKEGEDGGDWQMAFVLPNLLLTRDAFEFGDLALVGAEDARLLRISEANPAAAALLAGFDHCLPDGSRPSAAIIRKGHRFTNPWEALVDARNLVAVLACCHGWIRSIGLQNRFAYRDTDHFDFYPYRPSDDGHSLLCINSERNRLTSRLDKFRGATHPSLFIDPSHRLAFDDTLLAAIHAAWERIHVQGGSEHHDRKLMRSLSVAYEACRVPLRMESFLHDHGKHCALWVSAFEALAHPGPPGKVGLEQVLDLIGSRRLGEDELNDREPLTLVRNKTKRVVSLNAAQQLYRFLYRARNDFLHGNELSLETFVPPGLGSGVRLLDAAPLVFHAALEAHAFPELQGHGLLRWNDLEAGLARAYRSEEDELRESGEI